MGFRMSKFLMVDIFAGLGGASSAMVNHPDWDVIRVECNSIPLEFHKSNNLKELATYIHGDITKWKTYQDLITQIGGRTIDLLWMSPPCTEFSLARNPKIENPGIDLLFTSMALKESLKPRYWLIENVKGAIKKFNKIVGLPVYKLDPFYLWGVFPIFNPDIKHSKLDGDAKKMWSDDPLRPFTRAKVPLEFSEALRQTIQYQQQLDFKS